MNTTRYPQVGRIRTTGILTSNSNKVLTEYLKVNISYFTREDGLPYTTTRIFPGPQSHHRIVTVIRNITGIPQSKFFGIYLIDMSTSDVIGHQTLYEKVSDRNLKIRNIVSSPNRKQLIILYDQYIQKHKIQLVESQQQRDQNLQTKKQYGKIHPKYKLTQSSNIFVGQFKDSIAAVFGPSGQRVYGIRYTKPTQNSSQLYLYKLNIRNMTYTESLVKDNCKVAKDYVFMSPWLMEVDSRQYFGYFATYQKGMACLFYTSGLNVITSKSARRQQVFAKADFIDEQYNNQTDYSASVGNINIGSLRLVYYNDINRAHYFQSSNSFYSQYGYIGVFSKKTTTKPGEIKCVDIESFYAFACIKHTLSSVYVNKISNGGYLINQILEIKNQGTSGRNQDLLIQDIFHYAPTNQLCIYTSNRIKCHQLVIKCTDNSTVSTSTDSCDRECKVGGPKQYWSPHFFSCRTCNITSCNCRLFKYVYDRYQQMYWQTNQCSDLDCSKIDSGVPGSEYSIVGFYDGYWTFQIAKCACQPPYSWSQKLKICRLDCSTIKNTQIAEPTMLKIDQCICKDGYNYVKTNDQRGGTCRFLCPNKQYAEQFGNRYICQCEKNKIWDPYLQKCVNQKSRQLLSNGIPSWSIALIVCSILLILAGAFVFIWKKCIKKNKQSLVGRDAVSSQDTDRRKLPKTQQNLKTQKYSQHQQHQLQNLCVICKKQEDVNCKGPCNHLYHFDCINTQFKQNGNNCPYCSMQFPRGISDLVILDKKQVFSIGEENQQNQ